MRVKKKSLLADILNSLTKCFVVLVIVILLVIVFSGVRSVKSGNVALIFRFGELVGDTYEEQVHEPGLLFAFPYIIDEVVIVPVAKAYTTVETITEDKVSTKDEDERAVAEMRSELLALDNNADINFADKYITLVYPERTCLLDYFSRLSTVFVRGTSACLDRIKASEWHIDQTIEELLEGGTISSKYTDYTKRLSDLELFLANSCTIHFDSLGQGLSGKKLGGMFNFRSKHMVSYCENLDLLRDDMDAYRKTGYRVIITAENQTAAKNLCEILCDRGERAVVEAENGEFSIKDLPRGIALVRWKQYVKGYELTTPRIAVLTTCPESREQ